MRGWRCSTGSSSRSYAEDRDLLPWRDRRFDDYSLSPERDRIAGRLDERDHFSPRSTQLWGRLADLFDIIDKGDEARRRAALQRRAILARARAAARPRAPT